MPVSSSRTAVSAWGLVLPFPHCLGRASDLGLGNSQRHRLRGLGAGNSGVPRMRRSKLRLRQARPGSLRKSTLPEIRRDFCAVPALREDRQAGVPTYYNMHLYHRFPGQCPRQCRRPGELQDGDQEEMQLPEKHKHTSDSAPWTWGCARPPSVSPGQAGNAGARRSPAVSVHLASARSRGASPRPERIPERGAAIRFGRPAEGSAKCASGLVGGSAHGGGRA